MFVSLQQMTYLLSVTDLPFTPIVPHSRVHLLQLLFWGKTAVNVGSVY